MSPTSSWTRISVILGTWLLSIAVVWALVWLLDAPGWYALVFAVALPVYYVALWRLAVHKRGRWEWRVGDQLKRGADRFQLPSADDAGPLALWFWGRHVLIARLGEIYADKGDSARAARFYLSAVEAAPPGLEPGLAAEAWRQHRRQIGGSGPFDEETSIAVLRQATRSPGAPSAWFEDLAQLLATHHKDLQGAQQKLERALERADDDGRRFKVIAQMALVAAMDGRFGAADGYMEEARAHMPSGDPGYQAFLGRMARKLDQIKRLKGDAVVNLKALIEGTGRTTSPTHLPEAPEDD